MAPPVKEEPSVRSSNLHFLTQPPSSKQDTSNKSGFSSPASNQSSLYTPLKTGTSGDMSKKIMEENGDTSDKKNGQVDTFINTNKADLKFNEGLEERDA